MKKVTKKALIAVVLSVVILFVTTGITSAEEIRLIFRGDDMGMTHGANAAFEKAFNEGVLTCGAIQASAPWFAEAAELCRKNPGWCVGVHLCIIGEWRGYRWRPVLPWDEVSSIVDEDGFLYRYPEELFANKPKLDEINAEFRAQIDLALKHGVNVQYIDTHYMGYSSYPGLEEVYKKIAKDYNVPISTYMGETRPGSIYNTPVEEKTVTAVKILEELEPGLWLWVCHIGIDSPSRMPLFIRSRTTFSPEAESVNTGRRKLDALLSIEVKSMILKKEIKLTNYRELWEEREKK